MLFRVHLRVWQMYKRSPILRAALSPRSQGEASPRRVSEKFEREVARIRMLSRLEKAHVDAKATETPQTSSSLQECDTPSLADEVQKTQSVITELITLFQEYRMSVETRMTRFVSEIDERIDRAFDERLQGFLVEQRSGNENSHTVDLKRLKDELRYLKEDQTRLTEKVKRINELNCESHVKSSIALKTVRDLINR